MQSLSLRALRSLEGVDASAWDALDHGPSPFSEYGFLRALEMSDSVGAEAGCDPHYLLVEQGQGETGAKRLVGAIAAYEKRHSYGEYIFDFHWARSAMAAGVPYYPKLLVAIPYTPAAGARILLHPSLEESQRDAVRSVLIEGLRALADERGCHGIHVLFCQGHERSALVDAGFIPRDSFQFHWRDRLPSSPDTKGSTPWTDFEDFLGSLSSRRRKQLRKERRRAQAPLDGFEWVGAGDWSKADLEALDRYYRSTVHAHGGQAYLRPGFFEALSILAPHRANFLRARRGSETIAGALFLETPDALYGRYWGCDEELDCLHFETAYYQGIDRALERGIPLFEAGAQGEHKLLRGFLPALTYSAHWLRHRGLHDGIRQYCRQEARGVQQQVMGLAEYGPFKKQAPG